MPRKKINALKVLIGLILILLFASGCDKESAIENCKAIARYDYGLDDPECYSGFYLFLNLISADCYCYQYDCKEYSCNPKESNVTYFDIKELDIKCLEKRKN